MRTGVWCGIAGSLWLACGARSEPGGETLTLVPTCVPGQQTACPCIGRGDGVQTCGGDGVYGSCHCSNGQGGAGTSAGAGGSKTPGGWPGAGGPGNSVGSGGASGAAWSGGSVAGSAGQGAAGSSTNGSTGALLTEGTSKLVDVFVGSAGIYVVTQDAVTLLDRKGLTIARIAAPREITSASFNGSLLVVADKARFTTYDARLNSVVSADVMETCEASVLVSQDRFVCGPSNDWDRVFYTYDAKSGDLIASSKQYTYNGIPMSPVPGTDDFLTVSVSSSPSDFHFYSVQPSGEAVYVNESPYHGDFRVTNVHAFDGVPPKHLITDTGLLLKMYDPGCSADAGSMSSTCFVKDGALGTLTGSQFFVAMDSDASGKVYGLVDTSGNLWPSTLCSQSCLLERVDVASRSILSRSVVRLTIGAVVAFRHDPSGQAAVLGYRKSSSNGSFSTEPYPGYAVASLPY